MTSEIFKECFHAEFVSSARRKMKEIYVSEKAIHILDNEPTHSTDLTSDDGKLSVFFLPANYTPLLQHVILTGNKIILL